MPAAVFLMMTICVATLLGAGWRTLGRRAKLSLLALYMLKVVEFGAVTSIEPRTGFGREWWVYGIFSSLYTVWLAWALAARTAQVGRVR